MRPGEINGLPCLLDDSYHPEEAVLGYPHRRYIRHDDTDEPATLEQRRPLVNFWGTVYFQTPPAGDPLVIDDWGWLD